MRPTPVARWFSMQCPFGSLRGYAVALFVLVIGPSTLHAQGTPPIRVVRVGMGNVEGLRSSITANSDACRVAKHLPQQDVALPPDSVLAKFAVMEVEELFDGQHYAIYTTQRQIGADGASGCRLVVFAQRSATADVVCSSRVRGGTPLLGQLMNFDQPSLAAPEIFEQPLPAAPCAAKPRIEDLSGLPRADAGAAKCVWSADLMSRQMEKITGKPSDPAKGFDTCRYEAMPTYYYQGAGKPVILMTHILGDPAGGTVLERTMGETAAPGHMMLKSFSTSEPIARGRFERSAVESFLQQPAKSGL